MRPSLSEADLLLAREQLDRVLKARSSQGLPAITEIIAAAAQTIHDYTARYDLDPGRWRRLTRALATYELLNYPGGSCPKSVESAYEAAMKEIADIRDGKFRDVLTEASGASAPTATIGAWGSGQPITWPTRPTNPPGSSVTP